jgi:hypothetical protein
MKYFWDGNEVTREEAKRLLLDECDEAKERSTFKGRIFYNIDYLEHSAKQYMKVTGEKDWSYFSLRLTL